MERINKLKEYLKSSPEDSFLQHALALEYIKLGNDGEAETLFMRLLAGDPGYVGSYYHLGKLLERNNKTEEAIEIYRKGMVEATKVGETLAFNELKGAFDELTF